jgi:hypothetical protein
MFENFGDYVGDEVSVISSPKSVTNESGTSATFSVVVNSASTVFYRGATNALATYQWYSVIGGVTNLIPGANGGTYTTPLLTTNLDGEKVYCAISAIGSATTIDSVAATLTVTENPTVPTIVSAFGQYDSNTSLQYVDITFSETMNMASILNTTNYSIADNTITAAMLFTNNLGVGEPTNVILELGTQLTGDFTLVVSNKVQSFSGIPIAADDTSIATTLDPLSSIDIPYTVAPTNGTTYYEGAGSYLVNASGSSIFWNDQDSFHYVYTTRTNNFNIVVQVPSIIPGHSWSVAGLMARETIDPNDGGSRMVAVVTTAAATQLALDGTYGANTLSMSARDTNDGAAFEPGGAYEPGAYIGDYVLAPSYPNQWLLLTRQTDATSDLFTAYASTNAVNWTWVGDFSPLDGGEDTNFPSVVWVGMCTSSDSDNNDLATATYQNFGDYVGHVFLTNSPTNVTVESGTSATFSVLVGSDTFTMNGVINMFPVTYQWYTNSVAVPGATADIYTTPLTTASLNGEQVYCAMTAMGATTATNSATATLTVTANPAVPTIVSAFAEYDSGTSDQYVDVTFSEVMNVASLLNSANYSITGYTITGVKLFTNDLGVGSTTMAILQLNKALTGGFTLNVNNVQSFSGIAIAANTSITTTADPLTSIDIGVFSLPGTTYYEGPGSYEVDASGQDIWNTLDGFRFVYTTRTNNFDVVVQVPFILPADAWSKAGLMARETIDPKTGGSRMIAVYTTAAASQLALDGTYGENTVSMAVRDTTGTTNETSDVGEAYQPADYIGDGIIAPSYPNQWLRLTRVTDGTTDLFTAYASTNKADWTWLGDFNPVTTGADKPFPSVVNVGMASSTDIYTPNNFLPDTNTLLVTAMYQNFGDYLAVPVPTLKATLVAVSNSVTISWTPTGGSLYSSPVLNGTNWALVTTNNPAAIPITKTDQSMFFKVGP